MSREGSVHHQDSVGSRLDTVQDSAPSKQGVAARQLFTRLTQEIDEQKPANTVFFVVDFLCKHYPDHLQGFASIWNTDAELDKDRTLVIEFFKFQKIPNSVAVHFTNAGFDTLESLCTLTRESIDDIESFNKTKWLPGHQIRLKQMFSDIAGRIRAFRQEREKLMQIARLTSGHCDHPAIMTRTNLPPNHHIPALSYGPNPLPRVRPLPMGPQTTSITPPNFQTVTFTSSAANSGAGMPMVHTGSAM
eukprot:GHVU01064644.1.p1 GENE.GHVU01064644.1~~GHVU01064644.1.p1  ORF type:complete len:247 (+),score=28.76 GHVU01064644.1:334-1074(+)